MSNLFVNGCFSTKEDAVDVHWETGGVLYSSYADTISGVRSRVDERFIWMKYKDANTPNDIIAITGHVLFKDKIACVTDTRRYDISWLELLEGNCDSLFSNCKIQCYKTEGDENPFIIPLDYTPIIEFERFNKISLSFEIPIGYDFFTLQLGIQIVGKVLFFHSSYYDIQIQAHHTRTTKYRGAMCNSLYATDTILLETAYAKLIGDLGVFKSWGANLIRFQLISSEYEEKNYRLEEIVKEKLPYIVQLLKFCALKGMKVVIALMDVPGGVTDVGRHRIFENEVYYNQFLEIWETIAKYINDEAAKELALSGVDILSALYAYDLINEPRYYPAETRTTLIETQQNAAERIRLHDTQTPIAIECTGANPQDFHQMKDVTLDNVIYEIHVYFPMGFTHQRVLEAYPVINEYPGIISNLNPELENDISSLYADKEWLRTMLSQVIQFQESNPSARIYVGEFSAPAWAKGADKYLEDCISIFEEYKWDWTYHAFREATVWDVEYESKSGDYMDIMENPEDHLVPATQDTGRKKVLLKYYDLNGII